MTICRRAIAALALAVTAALASGPGRAAELPRVGVLLYDTAQQRGPALIAGLRDEGLADGKNIVLIVRAAEGQGERLAPLAAELVAAKPDVIVTAGTQAIEALRRASATIPIVMAIIGDPVADGFVASLAHPGGNLTGLSMVNTELSSKRLELLKEAVPGMTRVAVLSDPTMGAQGLPETEAAARALGLQLQVIRVTASELERGFVEAERGRAQAVMIMPTPFYNVPEVRQRIGDLAEHHKLPSMCEEISFVRAGCLLSYGPDFEAMWRRSAVFAAKILKGAKPADLPVEQPTKFDFYINGKTAHALGLAIPPILRTLATEVIE